MLTDRKLLRLQGSARTSVAALTSTSLAAAALTSSVAPSASVLTLMSWALDLLTSALTFVLKIALTERKYKVHSDDLQTKSVCTMPAALHFHPVRREVLTPHETQPYFDRFVESQTGNGEHC